MRHDRINGLTAHQYERLHESLLQRRDALKRSILSRGGAYSGHGGLDDLDILIDAPVSQAQAVVFRVMEKESKLLVRVEKALGKFEMGEYGLCETSGEPIGFARLSVVPWARYCIEHKEQRERRQYADSARRAGR